MARRRCRHDEAPLSVWEEVIEGHPDLRVTVVLNKSVPCEILDRLATDEDERVRFFVAMKRKLRPKTFQVLARDPSPSVRMRVTYNRKTPLPVLRELANDAEDIAAVARTRLAERDASKNDRGGGSAGEAQS